MDEYEALLERLRADPTPVSRIASEAGISRGTLQMILSGGTPNPRIDTYKKLVAWADSRKGTN